MEDIEVESFQTFVQGGDSDGAYHSSSGENYYLNYDTRKNKFKSLYTNINESRWILKIQRQSFR